LIAIETQLRRAIRDAVNRPSRKPFHWGGLAGYRQLEAVAQELHTVSNTEPETAYLQLLAQRVDRVLKENRVLAADLQAAHTWIRRIADCLRYPPNAYDDSASLTSQQAAIETESLMQEFRLDFKRQPAQASLYHAWHRRWRAYGPELLHCYDIPDLPPDNLALEGLFGRLRCHQRRISGRKSTQELCNFGQYQVLFMAESEADLLRQLQQVPLVEYQAHRRRLQAAEAPRQFLRRLHHDPVSTMQLLMDRHAARRAELTCRASISGNLDSIHTS
jgi:hypothetical protein